MLTAVVTGAGGFIGSHLVKRLKKEGYYVKGVDIKYSEFSPTEADEFAILDLRFPNNCYEALLINGKVCDLCCSCAAQMGGMGYISFYETDIMHDSSLININMIDTAAKLGIKKYFFSSSVCVYRDMKIGEPEIFEKDAIPAHPENEYGWEKLYTERIILAYVRKYGFQARIARFQNTFGPEGTWTGGREKFPAAICRKIAEVDNNGTIEVWGDGTAVRSYTYIDDLINGIILLINSDCQEPVNIGNPEYVNVSQMIDIVSRVSDKNVNVKYIDGPIGVESRNFSNSKIYSLGWKSQYTTKDGIRLTYPWIQEQVLKSKKN